MTSPCALIIGASSDMATDLAHVLARQGFSLILAAREPKALATHQADLAVRYQVQVDTLALDVLALETHETFIDSLHSLPDVAICFVGTMGSEEAARSGTDAMTLILRSNFEGPAHLLGLLANRFVMRGRGTLVGVSSVAGERGRGSNYIYGSAKAGFTAFLSGLRNRLAKSDVHVVTVLPGFVATKMTAGMNLPPLLTAAPRQVSEAIARSINSKRNVIYVKPVWMVIMAIIRSIPEPIFKKLSL